MSLEFIATEHFSDGRYGKQEFSYYKAASGIEARQRHSDGKTIVLTRYLIADESEKQTIIAHIHELAVVAHKSSREHDYLSGLLRRLPRVHGVVKVAEADNPIRKVVVSVSSNLPFNLTQDDLELMFR
jgi:hypothetical protein